MPSKSSKWIAALITLAVIVLSDVTGFLLNSLASHRGVFEYFNDRPWFNIVMATAALALVIFLVTTWLHSRSGDSDDIAAIREDTAAMRKVLEERYDRALGEGLIPAQSGQDKDAEITRLTEKLRKLQQQVAARSSEPPEAELSKLLAAGDLDGALRLKSEQVQARRAESAKLPRDLYELGTIRELRFEWPQALEAFREAWQLGRDPEHGFKYAHFAQTLNHFSDAIAAYEALLGIYTDPPDRAMTLNNLAVLYRDTQRMREAEQAYAEALAIRRKLAEANPDAYLPDVATTLNNLAILFRATQRMKEAEQAYGEALALRRKLAEANPDAYLPNVAGTLNNLAILYRDTQRMKEAEQAYAEALAIRRKLAEANPDAYLPDVAETLNNLAILYRATQRMKEAERAYGEALAIRRKLAEANPDAYLPDVAMTLNNLAILFSATKRMKEAEQAYGESLAVYRKLAEANPDAYLPYVAGTLNNLANLYGATRRMKEAEQAFGEALALHRKLAEANPDAYLPDVAMTLNNLAALSLSNGKTGEARTHAAEAECILQPLWQANPELHGNQMAETLGNLALISEANQDPAEACAYARRALAAAYNPVLRESIRQDVDRLCPESPG